MAVIEKIIPKLQLAHKDWINDFLDYTSGIPSPEIFRLWSAITCVAGALERRVYIVSAGTQVFPTLYTLLVGKPGTGKSQAIRHVNALWYATKDLHVASHSVTKASLADELHAAKRCIVPPNGTLIEYHSLQIAASEFGVLVPAHDLEFLNFLNAIYDNDSNYRESRRTGNRKIDAINPQINILAGTQPAYLASLLPEEAWGMGFMTRMIMVYSGEKFNIRLFDKVTANQTQFGVLLDGLKSLLNAFGEADWQPDAMFAVQAWADSGFPPEPEHSRLESYNSRRILHLLRLCIVSAASGGHSLYITLGDFHRALNWLIQAEQTMPDIFKEMVQRSDSQIIQELHMFVWNLWIKSNKQNIHSARLWNFLQTKVPSDKIQRVLETAIRSNILDHDPTADTYRPRPRSEHGLE
jgi:hypothetical protein